MSDVEKGAAMPQDEQTRRTALKAAGDAYFKRILAQEAAQSASSGAKEASAPPAQLPALHFDADFQQLETVVEGARTYVLITLMVIGSAAGLVFQKASVDALVAPALVAFLHLLPTSATLWLLAAQGSIDLSAPLSPRALRGAAPSAALSAARLYLVLAAAPRCSLWQLLCWSVMVPLGVRATGELVGGGGGAGARPAGPLAGLALGLAATAGALAVGPWPGPGGLLALLLWAAVEAAAAGWGTLRAAPDRAAALLGGEGRAAPLRAAAEAEASLGPATLAFLQAALPVLPLLALGFATGEGSELVNHELSVPAVTKILISVVCWAAAATCGLLTSDCLTRTARAALAAAAPLGTVVIEAAVHGVAAGQAAGLAAAAVAAAAGLGLRLAAVTRQLL